MDEVIPTTQPPWLLIEFGGVFEIEVYDTDGHTDGCIEVAWAALWHGCTSERISIAFAVRLK